MNKQNQASPLPDGAVCSNSGRQQMINPDVQPNRSLVICEDYIPADKSKRSHRKIASINYGPKEIEKSHIAHRTANKIVFEGYLEESGAAKGKLTSCQLNQPAFSYKRKNTFAGEMSTGQDKEMQVKALKAHRNTPRHDETENEKLFGMYDNIDQNQRTHWQMKLANLMPQDNLQMIPNHNPQRKAANSHQLALQKALGLSTNEKSDNSNGSNHRFSNVSRKNKDGADQHQGVIATMSSTLSVSDHKLTAGSGYHGTPESSMLKKSSYYEKEDLYDSQAFMQALDLKPKRTMKLKMRMDDGELHELDESCVKQRLGTSDQSIPDKQVFEGIPILEASEQVAPILDKSAMDPVKSELIFGKVDASEMPQSTALIQEEEYKCSEQLKAQAVSEFVSNFVAEPQRKLSVHDKQIADFIDKSEQDLVDSDDDPSFLICDSKAQGQNKQSGQSFEIQEKQSSAESETGQTELTCKQSFVAGVHKDVKDSQFRSFVNKSAVAEKEVQPADQEEGTLLLNSMTLPIDKNNSVTKSKCSEDEQQLFKTAIHSSPEKEEQEIFHSFQNTVERNSRTSSSEKQ